MLLNFLLAAGPLAAESSPPLADSDGSHYALWAAPGPELSRVCAYLASWSFPVEFQAAVERPSSWCRTNVKIVTDEKSTQFRDTVVYLNLVVPGCAGNGARVGGRQDAVHGSSPGFRTVQPTSLCAGPAPSSASFRHPIRSGCAFRRIRNYLSGIRIAWAASGLSRRNTLFPAERGRIPFLWTEVRLSTDAGRRLDRGHRDGEGGDSG